MAKSSEMQIDKYATDAEEWRRAARANYNGAMFLFQSLNPFHWFPATIVGHHALEQLLKSALIRTGYKIAPGNQKDYAWGHDLGKLAKLLAEHSQPFPLSKFKEIFTIFDSYFEEFRYPIESKKNVELGKKEATLFSDCFLEIEKFAFSLPSTEQQ